MQYELQTPAQNERGPLYTDTLLRSLHGANRTRLPITLSLVGERGETGLTIDVPPSLRPLLWNDLLDAYPGTTLTPYQPNRKPNDVTVTADLTLRPDILPLRLASDFDEVTPFRVFADPLGGVLSALKTGRRGRITTRVNLTVCPLPDPRAERFRDTAHVIAAIRSRRLKSFLLNGVTSNYLAVRWAFAVASWLLRWRGFGDSGDAIPEKPDAPLFACSLRIEASGPRNAEHVLASKLDEIAGALARFHTGDCQFERRDRSRSFVLSTQEIATLWHPPTESADSVSRVRRNSFHELAPPVDLPSKKETGDVVLGRVVYRGQRDPVILKEDDLRRHLFILGRTGSGKSVLLSNIARQRIEDGRGTIVIDPHGDLVESIRSSIKGRRKNDVIYLNAADSNGRVFYNPLIGPPGADAGLVADGVLTAFQQTFGLDAASAPRLLHILRSSLLTLIGQPDVTLASINRLLTDDLYRKSMVGRCTSKAVAAFWTDEFARWPNRERPLIVASLQNKLGPFTTSERLQHILCTPTNKAINLRELMDRRKVLLVNLSKGQTGQDTSKLLGSLLLSGLHLAAMSRANVPESDRPDCTIIVDEIASYLSDENTTIAESLAELRKYRATYVLASQLLVGQLDDATRTAVLGNIGSLIAMTIGPIDAELISPLMGQCVDPTHLVATPRFHAYARLITAGRFCSATLAT